jgi:hypothetical protein
MPAAQGNVEVLILLKRYAQGVTGGEPLATLWALPATPLQNWATSRGFSNRKFYDRFTTEDALLLSAEGAAG